MEVRHQVVLAKENTTLATVYQKPDQSQELSPHPLGHQGPFQKTSSWEAMFSPGNKELGQGKKTNLPFIKIPKAWVCFRLPGTLQVKNGV